MTPAEITTLESIAQAQRQIAEAEDTIKRLKSFIHTSSRILPAELVAAFETRVAYTAEVKRRLKREARQAKVATAATALINRDGKPKK